MQILRSADYRRMPWKNGKGETVEIAVFPPGASVEDFDWRISMATIANDGPFSLFAGIDRTLSVLSGDGILLSVEGCPDCRLDKASPPHAFPADAPASASLLGNPVTDLNVMTRRGRFSHRVESLSMPMHLPPWADLSVILCVAGQLELVGEESALLQPLDCAVLSAGESARLSGGVQGFLVRIAQNR